MSENILDEYLEQMAELEKKGQRIGKKALGEAFKKVFDEHPALEAIRWRQYTPHFNDGDPCVFSRHEFYITTNEELEFVDYHGGKVKFKVNAGDEPDENDSSDYSDGFHGAGYLVQDRNKKLPIYKIAKAVADLDSKLTPAEDLFLKTFGDGYTVTATRKGFEVEEYNHD